MVISLIVLIALSIGFIGGALVMSTTKPITVKETPRELAPLVPGVTRRKHPDVWVN